MEYQLQRENPIAVFDSGVGGISVLRELIRIMPEEDFIYFGDSKNAPYGVKTKEEVRKLTIACATGLFDQGAKGLVVACNTATSAAVRVLREMYPYIPIVGIEPAVKPAVLCMDHPRVLVMATPMTIHEEKLHNQIDAAVLGCTHYPFAREQIQRVLGDRVQIFDGGEGTAREMRRRLAEKGLLREEERRGNIVFQNSLADDTKIALCRRLLQIT